MERPPFFRFIQYVDTHHVGSSHHTLVIVPFSIDGQSSSSILTEDVLSLVESLNSSHLRVQVSTMSILVLRL